MNRSDRLERAALVLILITVGGAAGAASFTHVHDWTMANSPQGTPGWFGWANAVISELVPIGALLTIRQRRRTGGSIRYPMFLLLSAVVLSLSAQLAVAKPGPSGWLLSAVPALAFMGLSKLVLSGKPAAVAPAEVPQPVATQQETAPEGPEAATRTEGPEAPLERGSVPLNGPDVPEQVKPRRKRRPVAETRKLAAAIVAEQPTISRAELAARLSITPRHLRSVLNNA
ncbi:DUF2637 domain-containing protein [Plantactinospora sp. GCM10030261]|uniref:DUF2637 domain-containing protein n=1 Tax=Plantactinospora sp. GCM10030261 TaxID=3273420 RepID=UPI00361DE645